MSIDEYIVKLRQLSASCEFGHLTQLFILDRLVFGTNDSTCKYRLLRTRPIPTLADCVLSLKSSAISRQHQEQTKEQESAVNAIRKKKAYQKKGSNGLKPSINSAQGGKRQWCGSREKLTHVKCPARDKRYPGCGTMGHFRVVCRKSKYNKVQEMQQEDSEKERSSEDTAAFWSEISDSKPYWSAKVSVDGEVCEFKLDSGAEVTAISDKDPILKTLKFSPHAANLRGAGYTIL